MPYPRTKSQSKEVSGKQNHDSTINNFQNPPNLNISNDVHRGESRQSDKAASNKGDANIAKLRAEFIAVGLVTIVVTIIVLLSIVLIVIKRRRQYLSRRELQEFWKGRRETLHEASIKLKSNTNKQITNIFDGLMYQKQYELPKTSISIDYSNIFAEGKVSTLYRSQVNIEGNQKNVLVKIPKSTCSKNVFKGFLSEVKLLCYIGEHPNIIHFIGFYTTDLRKGVLWIVTECCQGGSLLDYLKVNKAAKKRKCNVQDLIRFSLEVARGMEHAFNQNAIHGNLSAKRILLTQNLTCKISGFSLARRLPEHLTFASTNAYEKLPWQWMAPETLRKMDFSKQSDVWSFGVTMWEIFSLGDTPYPWRVEWSPGFVDDLEKGFRMTMPVFATSKLFEVMQNCWDFTPEKRAEFCTLVECLYDCISTEQPN